MTSLLQSEERTEEMSIEQRRLEARIRLFYKHHNTSKIEESTALAIKYSGKDDELFKALVSKYGPEPVMKPRSILIKNYFPPRDPSKEVMFYAQSSIAPIRDVLDSSASGLGARWELVRLTKDTNYPAGSVQLVLIVSSTDTKLVDEVADKLRTLIHHRHSVEKGKKIGTLISSASEFGLTDKQIRDLEKQKSLAKRNGKR